MDGPLLAQIAISETMAVLTRRIRGQWRSYPVAPEAMAQALAGLPLTSGLLPPNLLGWGTVAGAPFFVGYAPARVETLRLGGDRSYTLQLPPLVWAGHGRTYRLFALASFERPTRGDEPLYIAPFPNVYNDGGICWGSAELPPTAAADTLIPALTHFLTGSRFSMHVDNHKSKQYSASIVGRWAVQDADTPYPLDDLILSTYRLDWLLAGRPWGGDR